MDALSTQAPSLIRIGAHCLSESEREELQNEVQSEFFEIEVAPFEQRSSEASETIRFVIQNIVLPGIIGNAAWDAVKLMFKKTWQFVRTKKPKAPISGWVISLQQDYSLNVMLPSDIHDLEKMMELLPDWLKKLQ